jgi:hypothetical protein
MDRTLFTPPMIETFRACRRAYKFAFLSGDRAAVQTSLSSLCKRFVLKALAEIHRCRLNNVPQVQKFLGQHWPSQRIATNDDPAAQERCIQMFRFVYRLLTRYIMCPYKPEGAEMGAVNLKMRARVPHSKVYLEDTFDLILWHPDKKQLELVDFHLHALKPFDPAWPAPSLLVRHFLAQRLKARWPFESLLFTFCRLQVDNMSIASIELADSLVSLHWPELMRTIEEMNAEQEFAAHRSQLCKRCDFLSECLSMEQSDGVVPAEPTTVSRSA